MPITLTNINNTGGLSLINLTNSGEFSGVVYIDSIRQALLSADTASYDAAAVNSFVQVQSSSYNNVFSTLNNTSKYGLTDAQMNGPNGGGTSWGAPLAFAFTASIVPAGNYVLGYSVVTRAAVQQSLALYYTTASNPTASTAIGDLLAPTNSFMGSGVDHRMFFIRKAPTDTLPANSVFYIWTAGRLTIKGPNVPRIPYKSAGSLPPQQITGSWLTLVSSTTGQPGHQFIATTEKQW